MSKLRAIEAAPGDNLLLQTTSKGTVTNYFAVLKKFDVVGGGAPDQTWNRATLEGPGGQAMMQNVMGYNVIIFPNLSGNGSIDAKLTVGATVDEQTISDNDSAGWRIFVF